MGYHRLSNSSSSKSFWQTFFMKFDIFFTLLEKSLKNLNKIQQLALISSQISKVKYHGNKMGYHRFSNSSSSKSFWQTFFMKFDIFFTLLEKSLKKLNKIQQLALISSQISKVKYHGNKMGYHRFSNSSSSKSYEQTFFMKFDFFFTLLENSLKNLYKIQ